MSQGNIILPGSGHDDAHEHLPIYIDHNGFARPLGNFPTPASTRLTFTSPIDQIDVGAIEEFEYDIAALGFAIKDQNGKGACNGFAADESLEIAMLIKNPSLYVKLSPWFIYSILCNGIDRGSNIGDALDLLSKTGTCLDTSVPYGTINPRSLSAAARAEAARFKIDVGGQLANFADMVKATQLRRPFNFSIRVGPGFDQLDADGCPRVSAGMGNHAVTGGLGLKIGKDGKPRIKWANHWTAQWGDKGYAYVGEEHIAHQPGYEGYDVIVPSADPQEPDRPPPVA